jgi:CubicO group peptidase (beta-lactamase class C family)
MVWTRGFGWADIEHRVRVDPETTSFHLASVTKPIAATVVLQLVDEARLGLDAPISQFGSCREAKHCVSGMSFPTPRMTHRALRFATTRESLPR